MGAFGLPQLEALPANVQAAIDQSTEEFRARFGFMAAAAVANGWISEYRQEMERIARLALGAAK